MRLMLPALLLLAACGDPSAPAREGSPQRSRIISKGMAYAQGDYLVPGYVTLLDFYADW